MDYFVERPLNPWVSFGSLLLIAVIAWLMGSTGLAMILIIGGVSALTVAFAERIGLASMLRKLIPHFRHQH